MDKPEADKFAHEKDALIIVPTEQDAHDALMLLPTGEHMHETLVYLPDVENADEAMVLSSESENADDEGEEEEPLVPEAQTNPEKRPAATNLPDEKKAQQDIRKRVVDKGFKKHKNPEMPKLSLNTLTNLPASIGMVQGFMKAINWKQAQADVLEGLSNTVVIVGQANAGKSTLFNHLKGEQISEVSPQAGTTKTLIRTDFGPFTLVDTPGHLPDVMETGIAQASLVVFLIDGEKGLRPDDRNLLMTIKKLGKPIIVAVNKIDALKNEQAGDELANDVAMRLGIAGVIPISARTGTNIADELVPAMIAASPEAALVIGRELPAYRRRAAQRIIRNAMLVSLAAGLEPIPLIDIPILLGTQVRLVLRLAALYGEPIDSADGLKHARELVVTMISGLGMRYLAEQAAKLVPFGGDILAGAIAGAATWSIGEVAMEYYEGGKRFDASRLRTMTGGFYKRFRKDQDIDELRQQALTGQDAPLTIEPPERK
ncbi:MAG: GTP-binding protein [Ktedonobacteraceae bacterium]